MTTNLEQVLSQVKVLLQEARQMPEYTEKMQSIDPDLSLLKATTTIIKVLDVIR